MRAELGALAGRLGDVGGVLATTLLDTNPVPGEWDHVTKVDPEEAKKLPLLYPLWLQQTDAVSVGGSADVTAGNTEVTFDLLAPLSTPVCHEPSGARHVTNRTRELADLLLIPEVLNGDSEALVGTLGEAVEYVREEMAPALIDRKAPWLPTELSDRLADFATSYMLAEAAFEAYIVQNPDSAAARESGVTAEDVLPPQEAKRRAMAADRHLSSEIVYLEYSGTFGGEAALETLSLMADSLSRARIWYGGGLADGDDVRQVRDAGADTVVVGDAFHVVADEEAELLAAADEQFDADTDEETLREWVHDRIDAESAGPRYLSTVPGVADPVAVARAYTLRTVEAWLNLVDQGTPGPDGAQPVVDVRRTALYDTLAPIVDDEDDVLLATIARAALSGATITDSEPEAGEHLSTALLA